MKDMGGRRRLADRRRYSIKGFFPERRGTRFRRAEEEHRKNPLSPIARRFEGRAPFIDQNGEKAA
jgi:hypothetical protein